MCIRNVAVTVDKGSISLGKATLPIRAALFVIELEDRRTASEKAVHGQNATARYGTKPTVPASGIRALNIVVKTKEYTASSSSGWTINQANPVRFSRYSVLTARETS